MNQQYQAGRRRVIAGLLSMLGGISASPLLRATETSPAAVPARLSEAEMQTAAWIREHALSDNRSYEILESLTTEVGARLAGSEADLRAVAWAEAKMRALGMDKVWKEPVQYPVWQRLSEQASVISPYPHRLQVTALGHSVSTPAGGVQADIVHVASLQDLKNTDAAKVRGKIVFIDHKLKKSADYGEVAAGRSRGASEAARKGALALVIRSVGTDSHRLPHTGVMHYDEDAPRIAAAAISNPDADLLVRMLSRAQPVRLDLRIQTAMEGNFTSYNVIGELRGSEQPDNYVLIGGHLDSWDLGTGAVDDGAGCAITLGAAEFLRRHQLRPRRSIRVVLYANEEQGLIGGRAYHAAHRHEISRIQAASEADSGQGPVKMLRSDVRPAALAVVGQMQQVLAGLGVSAGGNQAHPGPDMGVLREAGAASFSLDMQADDYFDVHHTADDTFDKIEPVRIRQSCAAFAVFAWMAAQSPVDFGSGDELIQSRKNRTAG
ncbi:M20/M25/M40 family metallo-hydrolase [Undibacterium curvum]|uniref:M20/M25/M40 family metallo-hydrolase n=1 Tax=Undibacterium curvum TaxID=2762294 RepID=UPI003D0B5B01